MRPAGWPETSYQRPVPTDQLPIASLLITVYFHGQEGCCRSRQGKRGHGIVRFTHFITAGLKTKIVNNPRGKALVKKLMLPQSEVPGRPTGWSVCGVWVEEREAEDGCLFYSRL